MPTVHRAVALLSRFSQLAPGAEVATLLLNGAVAAGSTRAAGSAR